METKSKFGLILTFFVLLFIFAKWGPAIRFNSITQTKGEPFIVSGEGKVFVTPDIAKISVGVEQTGVSLKQVQDDVNKKSKSLTDALKKLGVDDKDIKTTSYNLYPQYDYASQSRRILGYQISTSYEVTIRNFDKVNDVVASVTGNGANVVGGINFEINDSTKKQKLQDAREMAVKEAREKAEGLAKSANLSLGKIINISENQVDGDLRSFALPVAGGGAEKAMAQPDIQPGQTEISVTIALSYELR